MCSYHTAWGKGESTLVMICYFIPVRYRQEIKMRNKNDKKQEHTTQNLDNQKFCQEILNTEN